MKSLIVVFCLGAIILYSCKKQEIENTLSGEWEFAFEVLEDGSKNYDDPYAMLEFNYSDGMELHEDGTGYSIWHDQINSDPFQWENTKESLVIHLQNGNEFQFSIANITKTSLDMETPKGFQYHLVKKH